MTTLETTGVGEDGHEGGAVTVKVNNQAVTLPRHRVSGLEIKEAAIATGLQIELDFILVLENGPGGELETIANDKVITVTDHSVFSCNDGDEGS